MPVFGGAPNCKRCDKAVYMAEKVVGPGGAIYHKSCLTCKECNKQLDSTTITERNGEAYCRTCYTRQWGAKGYGFAGGSAFLSTEDKLPREILESKKLLSSSSPQSEIDSTPSTVLPSTQPKLPVRPELPAKPSLPSRPINNSTSSPPPPIPSRPTEKNGVETINKEHINNNYNNNSNNNIVPISRNESTSSPSLPPRTITPLSPTKKSYVINQTSYVPKKLNFAIQNDICSKCKKAVYAAELVLAVGNKFHKSCLKCTQCGKSVNSTNMLDRDSDIYCRSCYATSFGPKGYGYGNLLTTEGSTR
ncbi:unnamed protein product [Cunninghamella blakesleeana]